MLYNLDGFLRHLVNETLEYMFDLRKERPEFTLWFDEDEQVYMAKFSYGRVGSGTMIKAVLEAISHALTAVDVEGP